MFGKPRSVVGMVHVGPLPGAARAGPTLSAMVKRAEEEARILAGEGFDAIIVENMHDAPYVHGGHGPETVAFMTVLAGAVCDAAARERKRPVPLGVQVLSGGNREALAVALAAAGGGEKSGGAFIRCENFVFSHVADEGLLARAEAGPLLRYRRSIGAEGVKVLCDIKKKHASHAITADVSLAEAVEAAEFFGADGVIITGPATGKAASVHDVAEARGATRLPVLVGSGVSAETVGAMLEHADAVIVGSSIKRGGTWKSGVDRSRCRTLIRAADRVRARGGRSV